MKDKTKLIAICIIFIIVLIGIYFIMNTQTNHTEKISNEEGNMKVLSVSSNNFETEILKSEKPVLIDFYADWCGPCKMLSPTIDEIAEEQADIKICRINIDENEDLAVKYNILSIPTLVLTRNGEEIDRIIGLVPKNEILNMLK